MVMDNGIDFMQFGNTNTERLESLCKKKGWRLDTTSKGGETTVEVQHDLDTGVGTRFCSDTIEDTCEFALQELTEAMENED
jgi:hypothetical protein